MTKDEIETKKKVFATILTLWESDNAGSTRYIMGKLLELIAFILLEG